MMMYIIWMKIITMPKLTIVIMNDLNMNISALHKLKFYHCITIYLKEYLHSDMNTERLV